MSRLPYDLLVSDCARCKRMLISPRERQRVESTHRNNHLRSFEFVAGRIEDRPYCGWCLELTQKEIDKAGALARRKEGLR